MTVKRIALIAVMLVLLLPAEGMTCPVCFQNVDSLLLDAARSGVLTMAVVTVAVLIAIGGWMLKLRRLAANGDEGQS